MNEQTETMGMGPAINQVAVALIDGWAQTGDGARGQYLDLGSRRCIVEILDELVAVLFPGCHGVVVGEGGCRVLETTRDRLAHAAQALESQILRAVQYHCTIPDCGPRQPCDACRTRAGEATRHFVACLPSVQAVLRTDVQAAYEGDPAARSTMEVMLSYPGLYAVIVHRLAHVLYEDRVPIIPRIMSEEAHSQTGIDIHPGARIGSAFFIDHGTGVVIGETCKIGNHVKLYQGVTLGALSFEKDEQGRLVKGVKRHPDVEDHVVIYAGATILGGQTVIGAHSVIGGNVWLTHSVQPNSTVYNQQPKPLIRPMEAEA